MASENDFDSDYGSESDYGEGGVSEPETLRGRDFPGLRQFCVFLENRVGQLSELLRCLETPEIRVVGLSVADSIDSATVRVIVSDSDRARERLKLEAFMFTETDVLGIELPDEGEPLRLVASILMRAELNIHYAYPLLYRRKGRGGLAAYVDDIDQALDVLADEGIYTINEDGLGQDDEHFG